MSTYWRDFPPPSLGDFQALAVYNAERSRGIVHAPEWVARMVEVQEYFNHVQTAGLATAEFMRNPRRRWWRPDETSP